ncbi:MAG TPA: DUF2065 domain-containing protein [Ramlibacter sp.]|nr:DUF2065 domain-containing protein [Ramlibacter sp.]
MDGDLLWAAFALVLIFEGILPLIAPSTWRQAFIRLVGLRDGQLRFFGLCAVVIGLVLLALASA